MANYGIADEHGTDYTVGLSPEIEARRVAQRLANKHGKVVYLYEMGAPVGEPKEIEPADIEVTAEFPRATDTGVDGGVDIDVTVTRGDWSIEGEITMVLDRHRNNTWVAYGDGPDHWVSGDLLHQLRLACDGWEGLRRALAAIETAGAASADEYEPEDAS